VALRSKDVIRKLEASANPEAVAGMARYGISPEKTLGISIPVLRRMARETGTDHGLALDLWASGIHEARILASMVDDPRAVTEEQAESWVSEFDSWDVCDQVCMNLFWRAPFAWRKAVEWCGRRAEFEKRAGFALMARLAWQDKKASDGDFERLLPVIKREATDNRNYVKKAVSWALRQIGKRNLALNRKAVKTAEEIGKLEEKSARWIANDALKELESDAVQRRLSASP